MAGLIPPLAGRRTFIRAFAGLLLFELVALCGEWIVHQLEYLIVYGPRFGSVMQSTPHRYYMGSAGAVLALCGLTGVAACLLVLHGRFRVIRGLRARVPARVQLLLPPVSIRLAPGAVLATALVLAACQIAVYLLQENLEFISAGLTAPGVSVLVGASHLTVLPLHAAVALCGSLVLWTLSALCGCSEAVLETVQSLARRFTASPPLRTVSRPHYVTIPQRRLLRTTPGLRAPPTS